MDSNTGNPAGSDRPAHPGEPADDGPRARQVLPTITCVQTGWARKLGREVAIYAVVSDTHGVLVRGLSKDGSFRFARNHLYWLDALGRFVPDPAEAFVPGPDW